MCGYVGFCNLKKNISKDIHILNQMNDVLAKRGPDEENYYTSEHVMLGHRRLIIIDAKNGKQPMSVKHEGITYTMCYNGQIYNTEDIRKELKDAGFDFLGYSDTEVLLKAYIHFGTSILKRLNGIFSFAIWNDSSNELILVRDHFGIKPLYYTVFDNTIIFASEIKAILKYPGITPILDKTGVAELFGLGPCHTPGITLFKDIYELKPANFLLFNESGIHIEEYWKLESKPHKDSFGNTCEKVAFYLNDAIKRQLVSDVPLCAMLSGGLDSSIITAYASNYYREIGHEPLDTFSVDYVDNDKNFIKSDFQPNSDKEYIDLMVNTFHTNHRNIVIDTPELADSLNEAMIARDFPGMADVDSSMLLFCKNIKKHATVCLSGECSDEIFAGYPWFFREDALISGTFPWSIAISERQKLLNADISKKIDLKEYIDFRYNESLNDITLLDTDSEETKEKRKITYLTTRWFMQTLLDRSDRMSMFNGLELRVPFCDYRLVEYLWNVPWDIKALNGREKGLLRYVVRKLLPSKIVDRKKSPYPKTHNPTYLAKVKEMLKDIMNKYDAPIKNLLDEKYIIEIFDTDGTAFKRPWFGQLMTGPQLIAYLCQVNMWLERYNPTISL